jgi:GT2 family glycosyltransferase
MIHTSIILINYNSENDTIDCLKSLSKIKTTGFKYNVVIVDNASRKKFSVPNALEASNIEVIRSETNKGFTGGNNLGIFYAVEKYNSDFVLLLNNDTTADDNFLKEMIRTAQSNPRVGMVSSKIYFSKGREFHKDSYHKSDLGNVLWYAGGSIDWNHLASFHRGVDEIDRGQFDTQTESDFATGCSVLIKREILEKVGTFDKRFFLYLEDVDWSVRVRRAGYIIAFEPKSIVYHKNAGSTGGSGSKTHDYYQTRNKLLFVFKHGNFKELIILVRISIHTLINGSPAQRLGILHFFIMRFGKQPIV